MGATQPLLAVLTCSVMAMLLVGCGSTDGTTTVTEKQTTTVIREVPDDAAGKERPTADEEPATDERDTGSAETETAEGSIKVPDVVGKDHQLAQDTMQSAGLYNLSEEDATGEGRFMLIDRNWVVVEQSPRAGSRVAEDATIVLRSKKVGE